MARVQPVTVYERALNVDVPADLYDELNDFCKKRRLKKKMLVELAIRSFLIAERKGGKRAS